MTREEMSDTPFPCIVCGKSLKNFFAPNQPLDGCLFTSRGNYGSSVFDEIDGAKLEINICDDCLCTAQKKGWVGYWPGYPKREMKTWEME